MMAFKERKSKFTFIKVILRSSINPMADRYFWENSNSLSLNHYSAYTAVINNEIQLRNYKNR